MDTINVEGLPEPVVRAVAGEVTVGALAGC
jgi:hypothetical protein